jgi:hypothetical protein
MDLALVLFGLVCLLAPVTSQDPSITLTVNHHLVVEGADVTFTCRLVGFQHSVMPEFSKRVFQLEPKEVITETISKGELLEPPYNKLTRYEVRQDTDGNDIIFRLVITGANHHDSGAYQCSAKPEGHAHLTEEKTLEVYRPPTEIRHTHEGQDVVTLVEGQPFPTPYVCTVPNVVPEPTMELWITDRDLRPTPHGDHPANHPAYDRLIDLINKWRTSASDKWRDVTSKFSIATEDKPDCVQLPQAKDCPLNYAVEMTATSTHDFKGDIRYDGKQLTCVATMRQLGRDSVNASVDVEVLYQPRIICAGVIPGPAGVVTKPLNATGEKITCRVFSNPEPQVIEWLMGPCNYEDGLVIEGDEYVLREDLTSNKNRTTELLFKKPLIKEYFNKVYCLRAQHELGNVTQQFTLKERVIPPRPGAASVTAASTLLLAAVLSLTAALRGESCY